MQVYRSINTHSVGGPDQVAVLVSQLLGVDNAAAAKPLVDSLIEWLVAITGLDMRPLTYCNDKASHTEHGKAISELEAARCASDIERTRVFLQGVHQAIQDKLQLRQKIVILYAGTGPFGLLLAPLLPLFAAEQVEVTFLDIHQSSLRRLEKVVRALHIQEKVSLMALADATQWRPTADVTFDIVISETMKHLLEQEPQVQVFCHLQQFLKPDGVLIPEQIKMEAWLSHHKLESVDIKTDQNNKLTPVCLGTLFELKFDTAAALQQGDVSSLSGSLAVPNYDAELTDLKFTTAIQVYKEHKLKERQSQLTLPIHKQQVCLAPGSDLHFCYKRGVNPGFEFNYQSKKGVTDIPLADSLEKSSLLGIYHLKRLWHKTQYDRAGKLEANIKNNEWDLDTVLINELNLDFEQTIACLYGEEDFDKLEKWILQRRNNIVNAKDVENINHIIRRQIGCG